MHDENIYPTMRFMKCKKCGTIFVASLSGVRECPDCSSGTVGNYEPEEKQGSTTAADNT